MNWPLRYSTEIAGCGRIVIPLISDGWFLFSRRLSNLMSEEAVQAAEALETPVAEAPEESVSYHAVEKEGNVTAIWEMQGRKHIRTIDPRSAEGKQILALFETAA
jgi:hypothetical protein